MKGVGGQAWLLGLIAGAGLLVLAIGINALPTREPELPVLATIPEFELTDASGKTISRKDLAGAPWVGDLIFTSCAGVCPRMTTEMGRLEQESRDVGRARFVSISVDPETDTPAVLEEYAEKAGANRERWYFLTGERDEIYSLAKEGFLLPAEEGDPAQGDEAVIHSSRFVLVDREGKVRGTYDSRDAEALLRLRGDLRRLGDLG